MKGKYGPILLALVEKRYGELKAGDPEAPSRPLPSMQTRAIIEIIGEMLDESEAEEAPEVEAGETLWGVDRTSQPSVLK